LPAFLVCFGAVAFVGFAAFSDFFLNGGAAPLNAGFTAFAVDFGMVVNF